MRYQEILEACWKGYRQAGMKKKGDRMVPNCVPVSEQEMEEDLKKWFKEKWVRFGPDGKIRGSCARGSESEGKPKCLPQSKAHALGKKGRASAAAKKRREDPNPERRGPAKNVATKVREQGVAEGKIKLSTDPNWYGAEVGDYKASGPIVNIPADRLVGFEPDDKMNQPASKTNVEKIVAGLKQGAKLPPLLVRQYKNGYQVLDGHHRFWAYKLLGVKSIPAQVVPAKDIEEITKQGVAEMDKSQTPPARHGDYPVGVKGTTAKPVSAKKVVKDLARDLDKAFAKEKKVKEQYTDDDDWYDEEDDRLKDGDYVRDRQDGEYGEIFRMSGDPSERRVRILDRDGRGWYISPDRLEAVDPTDPDIQKYFGKRRQRDMDEASVAKKPQPYNDPKWIDKLTPAERSKLAGPNYKKINKEKQKEKVDEKQDACYRKVKSRYKVWPSAYASGALVQCRKKGAANWGTGSKKK